MTLMQEQSAAVKKRRALHQTKIDKNLPSLTIQSEADAANINNIMAKYRATGQIDYMKENEGKYINAASAPDFQDAMNKVAEASSMFEQLPSELRNKFDNDPAKLLDFVHNEDNLEEMYKLGLAVKPQAEHDPNPTGKVAVTFEAPTAEENASTEA